MVKQHYRWDFIGLSTDTKPTPATNEKVVDGSTYYTADNSKLYVWCDSNWYEKQAQGGGGTTYTAGENIQISAQNVISATDTTYSDFTGATSGEAGSDGLVPAPTTSDVDNFLKGDGSWSAAVLPTQMNTRLGGLTLLTISQTDYDNLQTYDQNTLYIITGA